MKMLLLSNLSVWLQQNLICSLHNSSAWRSWSAGSPPSGGCDEGARFPFSSGLSFPRAGISKFLSVVDQLVSILGHKVSVMATQLCHMKGTVDHKSW